MQRALPTLHGTSEHHSSEMLLMESRRRARLGLHGVKRSEKDLHTLWQYIERARESQEKTISPVVFQRVTDDQPE
jgi:hypothetical protein